MDEALRVQISVAPEMNAHRLTVVPVLCFVGKKVSGGERSKGVIVTDERNVAGRISALPSVLPAVAIRRIANQIDRALPRYDR